MPDLQDGVHQVGAEGANAIMTDADWQKMIQDWANRLEGIPFIDTGTDERVKRVLEEMRAMVRIKVA